MLHIVYTILNVLGMCKLLKSKDLHQISLFASNPSPTTDYKSTSRNKSLPNGKLLTKV